MVKRRQNVEMWKGNDIVARFTVVDKDGSFPDLSSATSIEFAVSDESGSSTVHFLVEKPSMTISGDNNNIVAIPIAATDVAGMSKGDYYLQLDRTIAGSTITSAIGTFFLFDSNRD